jgi:hypothetical protein
MRKVPSEPDPALSIDVTDGGMVPPRAPADVAWRVPWNRCRSGCGPDDPRPAGASAIPPTGAAAQQAGVAAQDAVYLSGARAINTGGLRSQGRSSGRAGASWAGPSEGAD